MLRKSEKIDVGGGGNGRGNNRRKPMERQYFEFALRNPRLSLLPSWLWGAGPAAAANHAKDTLKELLTEAKNVYYEKELDRTPMYYADGWAWER